ncbi:MAG: hypothetical protein H7Y18_13130 [Clostridiaceae bacterium]|nr:hypothetical protein [Clostridiaceae bacterium]
MRNHTRKLTSIAITIALLIVGGGFIYSVSYLIGGSQVFKMVFMSLYFSILLYLLMLRSPEIGTMSALSVVLGIILAVFSPIMTMAIILSGLLTDLTSYLLFRGYGKGKKLIISSGFYPFFAVIVSLFLTSKLTISYKPGIIIIIYIVGGLAAFILGIVGGILGQYLNRKYVHVDRNIGI